MSLIIPVGEDDHFQGSLDAPAILVEYGDYQCPNCGAAYHVVKALQERFKDDLCFVFRNMPLTQTHRHAQLAAEGAEAAAAQDKFWEMHDGLYENQANLGPGLLERLARALDLNIERFEEDLAAHHFHGRVRRDFMGGVRSGVNGTPTFFINGERYNGYADEEELAVAIEQVLNHPGSRKDSADRPHTRR
ncbi:MAG TPA: thioredoxin domain-containing protein [Gammaproteobacteria bacterium]|nr:thioredoxin domain-containing protein [Gammaproteobacteria bacterium]